jgi:hypothetical protein
MGVKQLHNAADITTGISFTVNREFKLRIRRELDSTGFDVYVIENVARREWLRVPRYVFELLRITLYEPSRNPDELKSQEWTVEFKGKIKFRLEKERSGYSKLVAIDHAEGCQGFLTLNPEGLQGLVKALFDDRIDHGSDTLRRIIAYHRLFKFTFAEGSESLSSGLSLRTDVLSQVEDYVPPAGKRAGKLQFSSLDVHSGLDKPKANNLASAPLSDESKKAVDQKTFKSRLAERDGGKAWKVDYQALFAQAGVRHSERQPKANSGEESKREGSPRHAWLIPLLANDVKSSNYRHWRCEMTIDDMALMRESFLSGGEVEYFLGFDIIDAIFKTSSGKLKTFRFPLYYVPVSLTESGRTIMMEPGDDVRFYLNHLALATMVEAFTPESNVDGAIEGFFKTLLAQKIEIDGRIGRIYLSRKLPCSEGVFEKSRDILLGHPGENGKGGLFSTLEFLGAECDTDAVFLYKASRGTSPIIRALELDLETMDDVASRDTARFAQTIPGRFLGSNLEKQKPKQFANTKYVPSYLPSSTRRLFDKLNHHDVVLLEGPPGTGKTHTIMNLLIHGICAGKRVLIVSDQEAAIHALVEKMHGYLKSDDSSPSGHQDVISLWSKSIKMVDKLAGGMTDLSQFCRTIEDCLELNANGKEFGFNDASSQVPKDEIHKIDAAIEKVMGQIQRLMNVRLGPQSDLRTRVAPKRGHATTTSDIASFVSFLEFMGGASDKRSTSSPKRRDDGRKLIRNFVMGREFLTTTRDGDFFNWFQLVQQPSEADIKRLDRVEELLMQIGKQKPRSIDTLKPILKGHEGSRIEKHILNLWAVIFPAEEPPLKHAVRVISSVLKFPASGYLKSILKVVRDQRNLYKNYQAFGSGVWRQMQLIHESLSPNFDGPIPASLEVCRFATSQSFVLGQGVHNVPAIQEMLERLESLEKARSQAVRKIFLTRLGHIAAKSHASQNGASNAVTQISSMLHALKAQENLEVGVGIWRELQEKLVKTFPIWLCRKQAVSFLFPCREQMFDLVIVDEATQCRVDDALPLMYRAKKVMVVGDDKQTVLSKNSMIDDYLFAEFNLDEHLRSTQARGIKGGGSHIFGLVKGIKEASVMLDEHYRCPPAIIEYSNRYVYGSELKVMQWTKKQSSPSVVIDWSEKDKPESAKPESGAFKGIETDMVDRFFHFVEKSVKDIERETGTKINMEEDVALCYFLLKNEPYIKSKKTEFLRRMNRGDDVLDGAGAALQGKERKYIFYLWDISRANMMAFRQGDDPDKRKGELNVLMSRPKKRAYHFLHKHFDQLDHEKSSITDFLWTAWNQQQEGEQKVNWTPRQKVPSGAFIPWKRSSGQLMLAILEHQAVAGAQMPNGLKSQTQTGVVVGDSRFKIDVVIPNHQQNIAIVDACGFDWHPECARDLVDYYFQLGRAEPRLLPSFVFIHELADQRSRGFKRLLAKLTR